MLAANGAGASAPPPRWSRAGGLSRPRPSSAPDSAARWPELQIADIVVGTGDLDGAGALSPRCSLRAGGTHHMGVVCSIDHVAQTAAEKRQLARQRRCAVEMEAGGVAERAEARGLPFYCVRVVTDLAGEDMANDFNRALRPDGHFATMRYLTRCIASSAGSFAGIAPACATGVSGPREHWENLLPTADSDGFAIPETMHAAVYRGRAWSTSRRSPLPRSAPARS